MAGAPRNRKGGGGKSRGKRPNKRPRDIFNEQRSKISRKQVRLEQSRASWTVSDHAIQVVGRDGGKDLAHFLHDHLPGKVMSIRAVRRLLTSGCCTVNGQVESFGSRRLNRGDIVDYDKKAIRQQEPDDTFTKKRLLYDLHDIIAYDKPAGLPVTATDDKRRWHLHRVLQDEFGRLHPVHRLDADTSGIVLFSRSEKRAAELQEMFKEHQIKKTYKAIVRGLPKDKGERKTYIRCLEKQQGFEKWGTSKGPDAREAMTAWKLESRLGKFASLMHVEPQTGRYHQIRIHFSEMGHPLFGDRLYGDRQDPIHCSRHMLHASQIIIPAGKDIIKITCSLPDDFKQLQTDLVDRH
ncbi:MAG: RluA family pseudouridine synthase [Planctomycetes bacterium]|nr:RluA family pseudouridine synthase [Planctomycetota bacterium]